MQAAHWVDLQSAQGALQVCHHGAPAVESAAGLLLALAARFGWARHGGSGGSAAEAADAAAAAAGTGTTAEAAHRASDADQASLCQRVYAASADEPAAAADEAAPAEAASSRW